MNSVFAVHGGLYRTMKRNDEQNAEGKDLQILVILICSGITVPALLCEKSQLHETAM